MADSTIDQLTSLTDAGVDISTAEGLNFVASYNSTAYRVTGQKFITELAKALESKGGIKSITKDEKYEVDGEDKYIITYANGDKFEYIVPYGRGIKDIKVFFAVSTSDTVEPTSGWSEERQKLTYTNRYLWMYMRFVYSDAVYDAKDSETYFESNKYVCGVYGDTGRGIKNITKKGKDGSVATYSISYTDTTATTEYEVYDGTSIKSIDKKGSSGLTDTYAVTLDNGDAKGTFSVTNGRSITSISETDVTHQAGKNDTYTINFNDGTSQTFQIRNGDNGTGAVGTVAGVAPENGDVNLIIQNTEAPTTSTVGVKNQLYFDTTHSQLYVCGGADGSGGHIWGKASVVVDSALDAESTNPVQNKAIVTALSGKQDNISALEELTNVSSFSDDNYFATYSDKSLKVRWSNMVTKIRSSLFGLDSGFIEGFMKADGKGNITAKAYINGSDIAVGEITQDRIKAGATYTANSYSIATTKWEDGSATISVTGVTADNAVIITPAPASFLVYSAAKIRATAQAAGKLTFQCESTPTASVTINVLIPR